METTTKLTPEILEDKFNNDVSQASGYLKTLYPKYPERPSRPFTANLSSATSKQIKEHAEQVEAYEELKVIYDEDIKSYRNKVNELDAAFVDYIKNISGLKTIVPEQYQDKLYSKAYENGHSGGFNEVYYALINLIEIFE